jgi:4-cresol dehydrogenase (hydroxylating) flavoprotein subunit
MTQVDDVRTQPLPPGVSEADFARALARFAAVVGPDAVLTAEADLLDFRDPFWHREWDDYEASAVVQPQSVEEIQAIVRIANELKIPLWTTSQGRNNGYGGSSPRVRGSVVLNLRRMNRVLEIDEESAYAVVEPGVRWFDLYEAIKAGGHKLMLSIADLGWGSVVGNSLDNGITYMPNGADFMAPCGLEVVLANGELLRTGMGAMPGNKSWHLYKRSLGPTLDPLFMQSNYGIVTRMGVWLMPYPQCYMPCWLRVWNEDDLGQVLDTLRAFRLDRTIEGVPSIYNTLVLGSVLTRRSQWYEGGDPMPDEVIDKIARELETGRWCMRFALYGDEAVVDHNFRKVKDAFERIPGADVRGQKVAPEDIPNLENPGDRTGGGVPSLDWNHMTGWYGGEEGGHIGFSPVAAMTSSEGLKVHRLLRGLVEERAGLDYIAGLLAINSRTFVNVVMMIFDTKDEAQVRRSYDAARLLVQEASKEGFGEYRAHLDFMDVASEQYSFGDHAYRRFTEKIKDAVDPNGILSPGKQGIWPASMRQTTNGGGAR